MSVPLLSDGMLLRFASDATVLFDRVSRTLQFRRGSVQHAWVAIDEASEALVDSLREGIDCYGVEAWQKSAHDGRNLLEEMATFKIVQAERRIPSRGRNAASLAYLAAYTPHPEQALAAAQNTCVVVIGMGGLGCEVVRHLAALELRSLVCVDHDLIDASNLNRQFCYTPKDVGRGKVEVVAEYLSLHSPLTQVTTYTKYVQTDADLLEILATIPGTSKRLIICCADQPVGGVELACLNSARKLGAAFAFTAMQIGRGYWGLLLSDDAMERAEAFFRTAAEWSARLNAGVIRGSASWENSLLAAHLTGAVLRCLFGLSPQSPVDCMVSLDFAGPSAQILADFKGAIAAPVSGGKVR